MTSLKDHLLFRTSHVCPWWFCWTFDNAIRRMLHKPYKILSTLVCKGNTVIDIGCGMGYFSIPLAHMVGTAGTVWSIDLQQQMLDAVTHRAEKNGVSKQIKTHLANADLCKDTIQADFAMAFWMIHEVPDRSRFFIDIVSMLKKNAKFLIVEPRGHVSAINFKETIEIAKRHGFAPLHMPNVFLSRACLMEKT